MEAIQTHRGEQGYVLREDGARIRYAKTALLCATVTRVDMALSAILWRISLTVVLPSSRLETGYFSADVEIAVWVTQFCVIIAHTSNSSTPAARRALRHRHGGQARSIEQPVPAIARDSRLAALIDWVRANLKIPHSLDSLAARAMMSRRSLTRHFRQLTGMTVGDWSLGEGMAMTQRLLESTDLPMERIADLAGLGSPASLRQHFRHAFGVTPTAWRQTFTGTYTHPPRLLWVHG